VHLPSKYSGPWSVGFVHSYLPFLPLIMGRLPPGAEGRKKLEPWRSLPPPLLVFTLVLRRWKGHKTRSTIVQMRKKEAGNTCLLPRLCCHASLRLIPSFPSKLDDSTRSIGMVWGLVNTGRTYRSRNVGLGADHSNIAIRISDVSATLLV